MSVTYVAGKTIKVGDELRRANDPVPEFLEWSPMAQRAALGVGEVVEVFDGGQTRADVPRGATENLASAKVDPDAPAYDPVPPQASPLRDRRDVHGDATYPGQASTSRPIVATFLKDDEGNWVEVPIGASEFPSEQMAAAAATDADVEDLSADAMKRQITLNRLAKARDAKAQKRALATV